ncbi:hypothetical protein ACR79S_08420 [Sphingobacterium spiritivorum]|uniref:hypothetical protein n=1 Tax=Sphingobacterium spiritivorum TaxID=258 RepID=UPI003DA1FFA5
MAIKKENEKVGIINKERQPKKQKTITSVVEKREKKQEKDGEAGVDPQIDQLNIMPDMHTNPKEPKKKSSKN